MNLEEAKKSQIQAAIDNGKSKVGNDERKVVKANRKTANSRLKQSESEEARKREEALIKATLKDKDEKGADDDEGWDSVEEDFPHIKLDDLKTLSEQLADMKIQGDDEEQDDDEDFEDEDDEEESKKKKGGKKEEAKKPAKK